MKISFHSHANAISFSYGKISTRTRFKKEAKGNSEMAYCEQAKKKLRRSNRRHHQSLLWDTIKGNQEKALFLSEDELFVWTISGVHLIVVRLVIRHYSNEGHKMH